MPLVRISLLKGRPAELRCKIGDAIHRASLGIVRSDRVVMVQITLTAGRSLAPWVNGVASYAPAETETA